MKNKRKLQEQLANKLFQKNVNKLFDNYYKSDECQMMDYTFEEYCRTIARSKANNLYVKVVQSIMEQYDKTDRTLTLEEYVHSLQDESNKRIKEREVN